MRTLERNPTGRTYQAQANKGLSRLGEGEPGGVGFLEGDQAASELEQGEVVLVFLRPADEQRPVTVEPGVGGFDDPAASAPTGDADLEFDLLAARADVRRVAVPDRELVHRRRVVAAVEAQPLRPLRRRRGTLDRDAF